MNKPRVIFALSCTVLLATLLCGCRLSHSVQEELEPPPPQSEQPPYTPRNYSWIKNPIPGLRGTVCDVLSADPFGNQLGFFCHGSSNELWFSNRSRYDDWGDPVLLSNRALHQSSFATIRAGRYYVAAWSESQDGLRSAILPTNLELTPDEVFPSQLEYEGANALNISILRARDRSLWFAYADYPGFLRIHRQLASFAPAMQVEAEPLGNTLITNLCLIELSDGNIGLTYWEKDMAVLRYMRTVGTTEITWTEPITLDQSAPRTVLVQGDADYVLIEGYPSVCYQTNQGQTKFVRALDPQGDSWAEPVTIIDNGSVTIHTRIALEIFQDRLVVACEASGLKLIESLDDVGDTWGEPIEIGAPGSGGGLSMVATRDLLYIAYREDTAIMSDHEWTLTTVELDSTGD